MHNVFVYGTLKRGNWNHKYYLRGAEFIGEAVANGWALVLLPAGYPAAIPVAKGSAIKGEIFRVDDETLERLNSLERHYQRRRIVAYVNGKAHETLIYYFPTIESGEFTATD